MTDTLVALAVCFLFGAAFGVEPISIPSAESENGSVPATASADMDDFMSADDLIRGCLADVHRSSASVTALIANLERSFGMDKESVLERFIQIASSPQEPLETRTAAIFSFCSGAGEPGLGRLRVFFADENDGVRQTALSATMGTLSTVSSQLDFLKERLDAWKDNERFQNDAPVLVGRFHQILQYKSGSEEERQNVRSFFRARAKNPSFPSCAFVCESILARFDPDWPTSSDRHELLLRWKDDSTLSAFARKTMNDAWASIETGDGEVSSRSPSTMVPGQSTSGETSIREVSGSKETDSTAEGAEPIDPSENDHPTGLSRFRLARIVGAAVILVFTLALAFRRKQHR